MYIWKFYKNIQIRENEKDLYKSDSCALDIRETGLLLRKSFRYFQHAGWRTYRHKEKHPAACRDEWRNVTTNKKSDYKAIASYPRRWWMNSGGYVNQDDQYCITVIKRYFDIKIPKHWNIEILKYYECCLQIFAITPAARDKARFPMQKTCTGSDIHSWITTSYLKRKTIKRIPFSLKKEYPLKRTTIVLYFTSRIRDAGYVFFQGNTIHQNISCTNMKHDAAKTHGKHALKSRLPCNLFRVSGSIY